MSLQDLEDSEDPRDTELSSMSAIYPEIQVDATDLYSFLLELPVNPAKAIQVFFPAPAVDAAGPLPGTRPAAGQQPHDAHTAVALEDSHDLLYLPSVQLRVTLPESYPLQAAPLISISTNPSWIPAKRIKELEAECKRLWEELGRDSVLFAYIDYLQQSSEEAFGIVDENGALRVDLQHKIAILDYDISARRAAFEKETFDCGVCLDPKRGSACHRMLDCGHVFCVQCLQDFYNNAIEEGNISVVRCLSPKCSTHQEGLGENKKKRKAKLITPGELVQIPIEADAVKRYVTLRYKSELESDKNTVYCPRKWCQGAARSKKHKKPQGLEYTESPGEESDNEESSSPRDYYGRTDDLLAICEDCSFAFCSRCLQTWHGDFVVCFPPRKDKELTDEEKASLDYLNMHTTPCPTCAAPAQKTQGCNHMICGRQGCETHFCYLCSAWLDPSNPYSHYNQQEGTGKITGCFGRLWELEAGDGDDVGLGFEGGLERQQQQQAVQRQALPFRRPNQAAAAQPDVPVLVPEIEEPDDEDEEEQPRDEDNAAQARVALEAPLVLRIAADPARPPPAVPAPPPAPAPGRRPRPRHHNQAVGRQHQPQNHQQQQQQQQRRNAPAPRGGGNLAGGGRGARQQAPEMPRQLPEVNVDGDLNPNQREWVQR